jgi:hypothetical protein
MENEWPMIPTDEPDFKRQIMGNIVNDLGSGMVLRFLGTYTNEKTHLFRSQRTNGLLNWLWDRVLGVSYGMEENLQLGVRFSHTISENTFYDLKLSKLATIYHDGSPVTEPSGYSGDYSKIIWGRYDKTPDYFNVGAIDDDFRQEKTGTISFDGSITSQITNDHQLMGGCRQIFTLSMSPTGPISGLMKPRGTNFTARNLLKSASTARTKWSSRE